MPWVVGSLPLKREPSRGGRPQLGLAGRGGGGRYNTWSQCARVVDAQGLRAHHPRCVAVGTLQDQQRPEVAQVCQYLAELGRAAADRLAARHAAVIEDGEPTTDRVGQDNQGQELPAGADRGGVRRKPAARHQCTVGGGVGLGAQDAAAIQAQHQAHAVGGWASG